MLDLQSDVYFRRARIAETAEGGKRVVFLGLRPAVQSLRRAGFRPSCTPWRN